MSERVLITGCSGFIGRALAAHCVKNGWVVRGSVRSPEGQGRLPAGVEPAIVSDLGPETDWSDALKGVDAVVHLASRVHKLRETAADPVGAYYHTNIAGTARLARTAAESGVKRFVFISTIKVNGEGREAPYTEADPGNPQDPYAVSKLEAERVLCEIGSRSGLETVILRPPLVYGPEVKANFLRLIQMIDRKLPLPFDGVHNRRSMIYSANLVDAIRNCLKNPKAGGKMYLVADDEIVSTPDLIREVAGRLGVKPRLFSCPTAILTLAARLARKSGEVERLTGSLWADTSKIKQELGWRPGFSLQQGLEATIAWYRATGPSAPMIREDE